MELNRKILEDLFYNKLALENNMKEIIKNHIKPFNNLKDYIKYGDIFLKLMNKK